MNKIVYKKNINHNILKSHCIDVDENAKIADGVLLGVGVTIVGVCDIASGCEIGNNSYIENSKLDENVKVMSSFICDSVVGKGTTVGPFANIKNNTIIGEKCRVGNFVEIKKSIIGNGVKIAHLTYVGDAELGEECNVGCGVVFCNYNGKDKQKTVVGNRVFIGSNVNLIAPLCVGDCAYIAAGSTVNKNVEKDQFVIARSFQTNKENFKNPYKKQ